MTQECNHIFIVTGNHYICEKCGSTFNLGDFANDTTEFMECMSRKCAVI